jgi:metal-responsive CopG/Arc/MetJ family transcriptional regulator
MSLAKRTYSLPQNLVQRFEQRLNPGERSSFLARLIEEWLAEQEREELRHQVIEGCRKMSALYRAVDREWSGAVGEVWREAD